MAFVDLYAETAPEIEGYLDVTHRRFEPVVFDLLPNGPAWDREDPVLQQLVAAVATEFSRLDRRGHKLLRELDPSTTFELLTDWEEMLGLPDCDAQEDLDARRTAILAKLLAQAGHNQSLAYWQSVLETLGYEYEWIESGHVEMTCEDECDDVLYDDEEWLFVWSIVVESGGAELDALLACILGHQAQIESLAGVHILWQSVDITGGAGVLRAIASTQNGYTVAVGDAGRVHTASTDLETWSTIAAPTGDDFYCACHCGTDGDVLVAAGTAGVVFRSVDGGESWSAAADATDVTADVYGASRSEDADDVVVLVGSGGLIVRSTDAGDNWTAVASPTVKRLHAVTRCTGAMIAVGEDGKIARSTDGGATWALVVDDTLAYLYGVSAWESIVVAVGADGAIRRSIDAGVTWDDVTSPVATTLRAVTSSTSGRWTAGGDGGVILQSLDDGETWLVREVASTDDIFAAGADYTFGRALVAGENGTAFVE